MPLRTIPVIFVVLAACSGGTISSVAAPPVQGKESPQAAVSSFVTALQEGDWEATDPLVFPDQLALLASIEGLTPAETAAMLQDGIPAEVRANFWEGFVEGFLLFAEEEVGELLVGNTDVFMIEGAQFGAVEVTLRRSPGAGSWVTRSDDGRWRVDLFATFGPVFASPMRVWLSQVTDDEHGHLIRKAMAAQEPSFTSALSYEPLGEIPSDVKFEVQLLLVEAKS